MGVWMRKNTHKMAGTQKYGYSRFVIDDNIEFKYPSIPWGREVFIIART